MSMVFLEFSFKKHTFTAIRCFSACPHAVYLSHAYTSKLFNTIFLTAERGNLSCVTSGVERDGRAAPGYAIFFNFWGDLEGQHLFMFPSLRVGNVFDDGTEKGLKLRGGSGVAEGVATQQ